MDTAALKVAIYSDYPYDLPGIIAEVECRGFIVTVSSLVQEVIKHDILHAKPDVLLLKINPGNSVRAGVDLIRWVKANAPHIPIVAFSPNLTTGQQMRARKAGAQSVFNTGSHIRSPDSLAEVLRMTVSGHAVYDSKLKLKFQRTQDDELSDRELEVLQLAAEGKTDKQIGQQLIIATNTVKLHIKHILEKLAVENRTEAADIARKQDLID